MLPYVATKKETRERQFNVRLNTNEKRDLDRVADVEVRTPADTIRILIKRAADALDK